MRKTLVATTATLACVCMFGMTSLVWAAPTAMVTPLPTPVATSTSAANMHAAPTATMSPTSTPSGSPAATPSASPSMVPHRVLHMKPSIGNPDLSGHVDYSFDPLTLRASLKQVGVDQIPTHYKPFVQFTFAGLQFLTLTRENEIPQTTISIIIVEDSDELMSKMRALQHMHLYPMVNPMVASKDPTNKCVAHTGYSVGTVKVQELSCLMSGTNHMKIEIATIPNGQIPIIIYAQTHAVSFDETAFKQLIKEINADKSMLSRLHPAHSSS